MKKKKNSNYKANFVTSGNEIKKRGNKFLIILVSVFVSVAIIVGAVFAIVDAVRKANAAVIYNSVTLDEEEVNFLASYYKYRYMITLKQSGVTDAEDTKAFWSKKCNPVNTYGEILEYYTRQYVKQIAISAYLYDTYEGLSSADRREIDLAVTEILDYYAGGDKEQFNQAVAKYGFDYSTFADISEMIYKASRVKDVVFGKNGSKLASEVELCNAYLQEYSRVKLMFIRTDKDFKLDENGNRITENGQDLMYELSAEEREARLADIEAIRAAIVGLENEGDVQMSATMFDNYLAVYKSGYDEKDKNGFYFHKDSDYTEEFSEAFPEITEAVFLMNTGSYKEVQTSVGVCFIYKYDVDLENMVYADTSETSCFDDFYSNAASYAFDKTLSELGEDVEFKEKYDALDLISLPYNNTYFPRF